MEVSQFIFNVCCIEQYAEYTHLYMKSCRYRKGKVIELIQKIQPTILGTQEGVSFVLEQLQEGIGERHYGRFGE